MIAGREPALLGFGVARPRRAMTQSAAASMAAERCCRTEREARILRSLYRRAVVEERAMCLLEEDDDLSRFYPRPDGADSARGPTTAARMEAFRRHAPGLSAAACAGALEEAAVEPGAVTHLLLVTCTGFAAPEVEASLVERLGLSPDLARVQIGFMGCHAALNALQVAAATVRATPDARVLVCCVELCSLHFRYGWDPQRIVPNALFADGAAAVVIGAAEGADVWTIAGGASRRIGRTTDLMTWTIGDHGFEMTLSPHVPEMAADHLRPWLDERLRAGGRSVETIEAWAIHAGGPRIVSAVVERLALGPADVAAARSVLRRCGNMSSATVLFILRDLAARQAGRPCVALAFGPGLMIEMVLLDGRR